MGRVFFLTNDSGVGSDATDEAAKDGNLEYKSDEAHCAIFVSLVMSRVFLASWGADASTLLCHQQLSASDGITSHHHIILQRRLCKAASLRKSLLLTRS